MKSMDMMMVHADIENRILSFVKTPPDSEYQLGYLAALVDLLVDLEGSNYEDFLHMCIRHTKGKI